MFCALLGHTGERLQDHWSSGFKRSAFSDKINGGGLINFL